jgi:nucleotide-binding universal stress UspA family protein
MTNAVTGQESGAPAGSDRVVVGVDGSPSSEQALAWAVQQAERIGRPVDAVIAWDFPVAYGVAPGDEIDFHGQAAEVLEKSVQNVLAGDADRVRQRVLRGHPARVLLHAADGAELLVVGCRGHGGFAGMLLGSVSQHVVAHAACPVVVIHAHEIPEPARAPADGS